MNNISFKPLNIAVLTISDSRSLETDKSGTVISERVTGAGHNLKARKIVTDDAEKILASWKQWSLSDEISCIISTGGTGVTKRDVTPDILLKNAEKIIDGFGELFRYISFAKIGASTIQSRAIAGVMDSTLIFCLPGSPHACKQAWDEILAIQLDNRTKPCNFSELLDRI